MDNPPTFDEKGYNCHSSLYDALVIDRNPIHRHLLQSLLEQKGYRVASDRELLAREMSYRFAMIDIDECRGFERQIAQARPSIPVVGLVSREEYAQPCLNAGAAATLVRPVRADQLFAVLQDLQGQLQNASSKTPPIDIDGIMTRVDGRMQILKKMVDIFFDELPDQLAALHRAIDRQSPEDLRRAAHALKGAVANFDAPAAYRATSALEQMGKSGHLSHAPTTCQELDRELSAVQNALQKLISSSEP